MTSTLCKARSGTRAAQSPFGPMRKREKPPVGIPGPRKPVDSTDSDPDMDEALRRVRTGGGR